jgi:hypothetical protein
MVVVTLHGSRWLSDEGCTEEEKVKGQFEVDFGLFCRIYAVKGKLTGHLLVTGKFRIDNSGFPYPVGSTATQSSPDRRACKITFLFCFQTINFELLES